MRFKRRRFLASISSAVGCGFARGSVTATEPVGEFPDQPVFSDTPQVDAFRSFLFQCRVRDERAFVLQLLPQIANCVVVEILPFCR